MKKIKAECIHILVCVCFLISAFGTVYSQGNALRLDNFYWASQGDFVHLGSPDYGLTDKLTVSAWIKWDVDPASQPLINAHEYEGRWANIATIDMHNSRDVGQFWLQHGSVNANFEWAVKATSGTSPRSYISSTTVPAKDKWVNLVGVYDGSDATTTMKFYINGKLENTKSASVISGNITSYSSDFRLDLGRLPSGYRLFTGILDEVRIYKRALSQEEVRQQIFKKSTVNTTDLVSYWALDETSGTTVTDQGSKNVTGRFYTALIDVHSTQISPPPYTINDGDKLWGVNQWQNKTVMTVGGAGVGNSYTIATNDERNFTLSSPWLVTPMVDGAANMTWMAIEDPDETTQWVKSGAPLSENATLVNTTTQTSVGTGGIAKVSITSTPSTENNLGVVQLGSASGDPVSTGETFPSGITLRSNLTWNIQEWGIVTANLIFDYSGIAGITDPSSIVLLKRVRDTQTWTTVTPTSRDNVAMTFTLNGQTDFYEYAIGSNANNALPVELVSFTSKLSGNRVNLLWETATEIDNYGFRVQRKPENSLTFTTIGFVEGSGTSNSPKYYSFTDNLVNEGKYSYRLKQVDNDGASEYSPEITVEYLAPREFSLKQNYPNPFNPSTVISFSLLTDGFARLEVFDGLGRNVQVLLNENRKAGLNEVVFHAENLPGGVYFYRLISGGRTVTKQMILLK